MRQPAASSLRVAFLHGLGQTLDSWQAVLEHSDLGEGACGVTALATGKTAGALSVDCPNLYEGASTSLAYCDLIEGLEATYADSPAPLVLCGLSLGAAPPAIASLPDNSARLVLARKTKDLQGYFAGSFTRAFLGGRGLGLAHDN